MSKDYQQSEIKKWVSQYAINGPRYTSYPTAVQFSALDEQSVLDVHEQQNKSAPLSLYVHIPFCHHVCYYCACTKVVTRDKSKADTYLDAVEKEMANLAPFYGKRVVEQLHFGGGTPTFLTIDQLARLLNLIAKHFILAEQGEFSIELDPRVTSFEQLTLLRKFGFNRVSLGIQDFNPQTQKAVNRVQSFDMIETMVEQIKSLGYKEYSFDLIYGLPFQSTQTFQQTLTQVLALDPDRIAVYNYAHMPERFKPQRRIATDSVPQASERLNMLAQSIERLTQNGYHYVGMDHFAKHQSDLVAAQNDNTLQRNFQGYSTYGQLDLLGIGMSSISQINGNFLQNIADVQEYQQKLETGQLPISRGYQLSEDDLIRQKVINQLSCGQTLYFSDIEKEFSIDFNDYFAKELLKLKTLDEHNLINLTNSAIETTFYGKLLLRIICMQFDVYLSNDLANYSKVV